MVGRVVGRVVGCGLSGRVLSGSLEGGIRWTVGEPGTWETSNGPAAQYPLFYFDSGTGKKFKIRNEN